MVKKQNMASGDHTISGNPSEYYENIAGGGDIGYPSNDGSSRGAGSRIIQTQPPGIGGTPAMYGVQINYPNSNVSGIQESTSDGQARSPKGASGKKVGANAPQRHPLNGTNPMNPVQRK